MSVHAIFRPPAPFNEPVREYTAGSPERAELERRLQEMQSERMEIPCVIGGKDVRTGDTFESVMPHRKEHVLADVHQGGAAEVEQAIAAAAEAWSEWSRTPWEERVAVFIRASELLAGPWRATLTAATMLNQSKTVHQAEIDAACELIDFWRFNADYLVRIYSEQPKSSPGVWNRMEYRPLEGFVFAVSPFNFTAIGGNLTASPALMGNTVVWKPASTSAYSSYFLMRLLQEAGLPDGVINLVYGPGAAIGNPALASPDLAGIHFTGSTSVFQDMWRTVGGSIDSYRSYPRIVGETGGKDFIVVHPSADPEEVATAVLRGSFEYQGQKCSAASRIYVPQSLWDETRDRIADEVATIRMGDVTDFRNFMGAVIDAKAFQQHREAIEEAKASRDGRSSRAGRRTTARGTSSSRPSSRPPIRTTASCVTSCSGRSSRRSSTPTRSGKTRSSSSTRRHRTRSPAPCSRAIAARWKRRVRRSATRPATSTSTTSRRAQSSASSRLAARGRQARTTRRARCGTSFAGSARARSRRPLCRLPTTATRSSSPSVPGRSTCGRRSRPPVDLTPLAAAACARAAWPYSNTVLRDSRLPPLPATSQER